MFRSFTWILFREEGKSAVLTDLLFDISSCKTQRDVVIRTGLIRITDFLSTVNAAIHKTYNFST
jgi:hypothetical protein